MVPFPFSRDYQSSDPKGRGRSGPVTVVFSTWQFAVTDIILCRKFLRDESFHFNALYNKDDNC
jgi:hypothetical protein